MRGGPAPGKPWGEGGRRDLSPQPEQVFYVPKYRALWASWYLQSWRKSQEGTLQLRMVTPGQARLLHKHL